MGNQRENGRVANVAMTLCLVYAMPVLMGRLLDQASDSWTCPSARASDEQGLSEIEIATRDGRADVVRRLLERSPGPDRATLGSALCRAAQNERVEILELLLRAGAPLDECDVVGAAPLWYAGANGNVAIAEMLLGAGARTDRRGPDGMTPIEVARDRGNCQAAETLSRAKKKPTP